MTNVMPENQIRELEEQIQETYRKYSIIDKVCTPVSVPQGSGVFRQFAKKFLIEREHITNESHTLILDNFGNGVARAEENYLLEKIRLGSVCKDVNEITYNNIQEAVIQLIQDGFTPDAIFLPINYFHNVWTWNSIPARNGEITENLGHRLFIERNTILPIMFSNKYIPFDDVYVVTKEENIWQYRPDQRTNGRLTAQFDWNYDDVYYTTVLLRTIFNLQIRNPDGNIVLKPRNIQNHENH